MSERGWCHKQILRLKSIDKWLDSPDNRTVIDELTNALARSRNDAVAMAVIDEWLASQDKLPTPAALCRLVEAQNENVETESAVRTRQCTFCDGAGFEIVERGGLSGAKVCRCRAQGTAA